MRGTSQQQRELEAPERDEIEQKTIAVNRVAKVVDGGRIFSFNALVVVGDGRRQVGIGRGRARENSVARQKALESARRNMIQVHLDDGTLHYPILARYGATRVFMKPASPGTGIIAGGAVRAVLELAGVHDVLTKIYGSYNPVNVVRATFNALAEMQTPEEIAAKRGKSLESLRSPRG